MGYAEGVDVERGPQFGVHTSACVAITSWGENSSFRGLPRGGPDEG